MEKLLSIVETSFVPPMQRAELVSRPRLTSYFMDEYNHKLTTIIAPAGFGKTTLAASWYGALSQKGQAVAWLSIDDQHNDASILLRYIIAAIRKIAPTFGSAATNLLSVQTGVHHNTVLTALVNEIARLPDKVNLILDDWHLVHDQESNGILLELIKKTRSNKFHLIIVSRQKPGFGLGRLRALDRVREFDAGDLQFSQLEINEYFCLENLKLSEQSLKMLKRNTEGWAIGLQLAAIAMRGRKDIEEFVNSFSGGYRTISEFLSEDVFSNQPSEIQDFLLKTSVLKRLCPALCNSLLDRDDSAALLRRVENLNLFLFPLDDNRSWYRYHHLFAEFLRYKLSRLDRKTEKDLLLKASQWFHQRGSFTEAIEYALDAGDTDFAAHLLNDSSEQMFASGQIDTLIRYTKKVPEETLALYPKMQLDRVWAYTLKWEFELATIILDAVKTYQLVNADNIEDIAALKEKILHRELMVALFSDRMKTAEELIKEWLKISSGQNYYFVASAKASLLCAQREQYDFTNVGTQAGNIRDLFLKGNAEFGTVFHDCIVGPAYVMLGDLQRAKEIYLQAIRTANRINGKGSPLSAMPSMLLAEVYYEWNQIKKCKNLLEKNFSSAETLGFVDQLVAGYICKSKLLYLRGDIESAQNVLDTGVEVSVKYGFSRLYANILCERIRQLIASGKQDQGLKAIRDSGLCFDEAALCPSPGVTTEKESILLAWARANRITDKRGETISVMRKWVKFADHLGCNRSALRFSLALASALNVAGDERSTKYYLRQALTKGQAGGYIRTFLDEGPVMCLMLKELLPPLDFVTDDSTILYRQKLVKAFESEFGRNTMNIDDSVKESVSAAQDEAFNERELEILQFAATCLANHEIGTQLGISLATVKWYMQRIYSKLGVNKRILAVNRARKLGLIK